MKIALMLIAAAFLLPLSCAREKAEKAEGGEPSREVSVKSEAGAAKEAETAKEAGAAGQAPAAAQETIAEEALIGDWATLVGDAEYVTFSKNGSEQLFGSYLRGRPLFSGTWKLDNGRLVILADDGTETVYTKVTLKDGILELNEGEEKYEKMVPQTDEEMVRDLLTAAARTVPVDFSPVVPTEMAWNERKDQETEVKILKMNGWKMSAEVKIREDFTELNAIAAKVASFFKDEKGFVRDELNISEIAEGYTLGNFVVSILVRSDPEAAENEPAFVDVICGYRPRKVP